MTTEAVWIQIVSETDVASLIEVCIETGETDYISHQGLINQSELRKSKTTPSINK